jgi:simple sugar transport system ATP-binding protein
MLWRDNVKLGENSFMDTTPQTAEIILKASNIKKSFSGVVALDGVDLEIKKGEIHCLAGENGCGKSTLIKIISGVYGMDSGKIELNGHTYHKISPIDSIRNGVQVIYQDFSLFPNLSVMENLAYNTELAQKRTFVNWKRLRKIAEEAIRMIDFNIDLDQKVELLSIANRQQIAICRALINDAKLIIMDEPTTALTKKEVQNLFRIIKLLQVKGISILFVSHKIEEVFEISERLTILRNGKNVLACSTSEIDNQDFSYYMTGKKFEMSCYDPTIDYSATPILKVNNLSLKNGFNDISFSLYRGEILGITGLLGSGRTELALSLFGICPADSGSIELNGIDVKITSVFDAIQNGIGYVPDDRLTEGLFLDQAISDNIIVSNLENLSNKIGILDNKKRIAAIKEWLEKLSIKTSDPRDNVQTLSGGNQQRVVLSKWMSRNTAILILNGPTIGVDIGSKNEIHTILRSLAEKGMGILIISDDLPEVLTTCNRILIMKHGNLMGRLKSSDISELELARECISN